MVKLKIDNQKRIKSLKLFRAEYVTAPNCSPSRAGLLTSRIPTRFGYEFNPIDARNEDTGTGLPLDQVTVARVLHDAGYATALIGKWHHGDWEALNGQMIDPLF